MLSFYLKASQHQLHAWREDLKMLPEPGSIFPLAYCSEAALPHSYDWIDTSLLWSLKPSEMSRVSQVWGQSPPGRFTVVPNSLHFLSMMFRDLELFFYSSPDLCFSIPFPLGVLLVPSSSEVRPQNHKNTSICHLESCGRSWCELR